MSALSSTNTFHHVSDLFVVPVVSCTTTAVAARLFYHKKTPLSMSIFLFFCSIQRIYSSNRGNNGCTFSILSAVIASVTAAAV